MRQHQRGFTLIELLIVVAIIGIIAVIAVPNLMSAIQRSKAKSTLGTMKTIGTVLATYQADYSIYPKQTTEDTWANVNMPLTYYTGQNQDAWYEDYRYISDGTSYTLTSFGKDQNPGCGPDAQYSCDISLINGNFNKYD